MTDALTDTPTNNTPAVTPTGVPTTDPIAAPKAVPTRARTYSVSSLRTSRDGFEFIFKLETGGDTNRTAHMYCPGGSSGITIGAGYDFSSRNAREIATDLQSVGVRSEAAQIAGTGAGKTGTEARKFCKTYHNLIVLSVQQQRQLLDRILPHYEKIVQRNVNFVVTQYEFDALVSLTFNAGKRITSITDDIGAGHFDRAKKDWLSRVSSDHSKFGGLVERRKSEVNLYFNGKYK